MGRFFQSLQLWASRLCLHEMEMKKSCKDAQLKFGGTFFCPIRNCAAEVELKVYLFFGKQKSCLLVQLLF